MSNFNNQHRGRPVDSSRHVAYRDVPGPVPDRTEQEVTDGGRKHFNSASGTGHCSGFQLAGFARDEETPVQITIDESICMVYLDYV